VTDISKVSSLSKQVIAEVERAVVGKRGLLEMMMASMLAGGHILLEDFPGLGKTLVARSFAKALGLEFKRIQFTPDLLPGDITGGYIFNRTKNKFELRKGPVFANIVLADEINRASPKTQSALLEAMQEGQVTIEGESLPLPEPFLVLATQNPIEYEGTFPLPEAQLDRFMFNVVIDYLPEREEVAVVMQTTGRPPEPIQPLFRGDDILRFQQVVRKVPIAEELVRYAVRLAAASRPQQNGTSEFINQWVNWGAGLRAAQNLVLGAKVRALFQNRAHVTAEDIQRLAHPTLRHRILLNYRAEAEGMTVEKVIDQLLETIPVNRPA
jgi:MoxR-like ATPases